MENILAIIEYESENDIIFLDENTEEIFVSYKNYSAGKSTALAIINSSKQVEFTSRGMKVQVVEENPNMKNYVLLFHHQSNQGSKLAALGKVYLLSENHTLVRLNDDIEFSQTGEYAKFINVPLQEISLQVTNTTQKEASPSAVAPLVFFKSPIFIVIAIILSVIVLAVFFIILWKRIKIREI